MKILYYGSTTQVHSGASQWMYRLAKGMYEKGWEPIAVLPRDEGIASWYRDENIDVQFLWSDPLRVRRSFLGHLHYLFSAILSVFSLAALVHRENIDLVHVNEIRYPFGLLAAKFAGATTICHVRACFESYLIRVILSRFIILFADEVVCVSERTREVMFTEVGIDQEKIQIVYDGLPSPERFEGQTDGSKFREDLGINESSFLVLQVSKLTRNKGQDRLLDVANVLFDDNLDIEFAIVGGSVEGHEDYARTLRERSEKHSNVHLTGFYPDIVTAITAADVLVHVPRHDDPFPGVVLEGMIAGKPVVGSRSGGIPEQIVHEQTGFLVPKTDAPNIIANFLCHLYDNKSERSQMGENATQRAFSTFPVKTHFEEIISVYNRASN